MNKPHDLSEKALLATTPVAYQSENRYKSIKQQGLLPGSRQHVHLSADRATAIKVGQRHGKPTVLVVAAQQMHESDHKFYHSDNNVWLVATVPVQFITFS